MQGVEKPITVPLQHKKGSMTLSLTALTFSTPPIPPNTPNLVANRQMASESSRKRAAYKKGKAGEKLLGDVVGKSAARKIGKTFGSWF